MENLRASAHLHIRPIPCVITTLLDGNLAGGSQQEAPIEEDGRSLQLCHLWHITGCQLATWSKFQAQGIISGQAEAPHAGAAARIPAPKRVHPPAAAPPETLTFPIVGMGQKTHVLAYQDRRPVRTVWEQVDEDKLEQALYVNFTHWVRRVLPDSSI